MDGSPYLSRPLRSEAEVVAEFEGLPTVWPGQYVNHPCGHNARLVLALRWIAGQPRSVTRDDLPPAERYGGPALFALQSCITNGYVDRVSVTRHPVSGLKVDHWQISARGREVLARADEYEREGKVF